MKKKSVVRRVLVGVGAAVGVLAVVIATRPA
ncbi:MAG: hypothetical protein K0S65_2728 [Labilithrix sp.]|nr:hypothetical protein [Labilithrix sp.]